CDKWTRHFPHLQIIATDMFDAAQLRLAENAAAQEHRRRPKGRLGGSRTGNSELNPRHLLAGLFRCASKSCNSRFTVSGANAEYLHCPNKATGLCECKTQIPRKLAEELILAAIGARILIKQLRQPLGVVAIVLVLRPEDQPHLDDLKALGERFRREHFAGTFVTPCTCIVSGARKRPCGGRNPPSSRTIGSAAVSPGEASR